MKGKRIDQKCQPKGWKDGENRVLDLADVMTNAQKSVQWRYLTALKY